MEDNTIEGNADEEGKDDWSLDDSQSLEQIPDHQDTDQDTYSDGKSELILSIIGLALAPLLLVSLFLSWKKLEKGRSENQRRGGKIYLALLISLIGIGFYLFLIALFLLKEAGLFG